MIFLGLAALIPAGIIAVLALSRKTNPGIRKVSIIALILIGLSVVVCAVIVIFLSGSSGGSITGITSLPITPVQETERDIIPLIIGSAIIILFIILVTILAIREQRKK